MNFTVYSHCGGETTLSGSIRKEIETAIKAVEVKPANRAASKLRNAFLFHLMGAGWPREITVSVGSDMTITSLKEGTGLCLQTGNMARMYADLIKLQTMYLDSAITAAAIILPSQPMATMLGSNIAQATRLERELAIFKKAYHVPTLIYALE